MGDKLEMKKPQVKTVIAALLVLVVPHPSLAYSRSGNDQLTFQTKKSLGQAALAYMEDGWSAAKANWDRTSTFVQQTANSVAAESESLAEHALDYQTAAWEKFQSTGTASDDLIEAKLHAAYAEIDEFTTGDKQKSETELEKAQGYLRNALLQVSGQAKPELEKVETELAVAKTQIGKDGRRQRERYAAIKESLSRLIH